MDTVFLQGGDEFIIIIPQTGRVGTRFLAERIKENLVAYFSRMEFSGKKVQITFSAGIATYPMDAQDYEGLIRAADKALYKSKLLGKNRIYDFLDDENNEDLEDPEERRKSSRCIISDQNEVEIITNQEQLALQGKLLNISPNGVLMECFCEMDASLLKDSIDLQIKKIGNYQMPAMNIKANVTRLSNEHEKLKFYLGLEFDREMEMDKWKNIERICNEFSFCV